MIDDRPREECGVIAVIASTGSVTDIIVDGLHALQHRGQEAAGLAVSNGDQLVVVKNTGLVSDVLTPHTVGFLEGTVGIGHTRYSTSGDCSWENAQPCFRSTPASDFALAHNGNLTGNGCATKHSHGSVELSDTGTIAESIAGGMTEQQKSFLDAVLETVRALKGAFSLVMCDRDTVVGVRDPNGFRPLCLGSLGHGWVLASETAALNTVGARFVREITPGEVVIIEPDSPPRSLFPFPDEGVRSSLCALEFMYLSRPDSYMNGIPVNSARLRMGEILARKALVPADMVIGVPESGIPASEGYSRESGIPWGSGLVKNRYTGRSFINPTQGERERTVRRKLSVLVEQVRGKRLVVVDDSVIRGTVTKHMASLLYGAGALEVHLRIASPPLRWPCFYGVDIGSRTELLARDRSTDQMTEVLGVDTLEFLTPGELREAIGAQVGLCTACMTGKYPTRAGRERAAKLTTGSPATRQYVSSRSLENSDQVPIS